MVDERGIILVLNQFKSLDKRYLFLVVILAFLLVELFVFINDSVNLSNLDAKNLFEYVVKVRSSSECLDKIFEQAELSLNVLADSMTNSYDVNNFRDKGYNFRFIKSIDPVLKSVLTNSPGASGTWFQLNSDLPFSAWAFNWYEFKGNQFIDMNEEFKQTPSMLRKINPEQDPYYFDAINSKGPIWSDLYKDPDTGEEFLTVSAPVHKGNTLIGVVGLDISKDNLNQALSNIHLILSDVDLYLLDNHDNLILSQMKNGSSSNKNDKFLKLMKTSKGEPVDYYNNFTRRTAVEIELSNHYKLVISIENKKIFIGEDSLVKTVYILFMLFVFASVYILACVLIKKCAERE